MHCDVTIFCVQGPNYNATASGNFWTSLDKWPTFVSTSCPRDQQLRGCNPLLHHSAVLVDYFHKDGTLSSQAYQSTSDRCTRVTSSVVASWALTKMEFGCMMCSTSFVFNPHKPVPTVGGNNLGTRAACACAVALREYATM